MGRSRAVVWALSGLAGLAGAVGAVGVLGAGPAGASSSSNAQLSQAKKALIVKSDFPSGWSAQGKVTTSKGGGDSSFPGGSDLASCLGVSESLINANTPSANSPSFGTKNGTQTVQDSVSVFPSTKFGNEEKAAISSPKVPGCMTTVLQGPARQEIVGSLGQGITIGTISVAAAPKSELTGDATGFVMSFPAKDNGVTLQTSISVITVVKGRIGSQLTIESVGTPVSASLSKHLVSVVNQRT